MAKESFSGESLDPTTEVSLEAVKTRAVRGVVVLTGRTFIISTISLIAIGLLTVFLEPSEFGVFWIVSAVVNFLAYFSDIGLAASLIQKRGRVTDEDLKTTFTVQQVLVVLLLLVVFLAAPFISKIYSLSSEGRLLLFSLAASLLLSSLKTIPSVLLERELEFGKLVIPQILENLVYNTLAVLLAWQGFGVRSFTYAVLARGLVGLFAMYVVKPWMPGFSFSIESLKKLLAFGVPYQATTFLATIKDDGLTAVLGGILGATGIGFLGWAQKWGQAPLRFFMDHVIKVTFPAFSRIQDNKEELKRAVTRSIFFITFLVFPSLVGLLVLSPILLTIIPRYEKWTPALLALSFIGVNTIFAAVTTQLTNLLNAIGKIKYTFRLMIMWTLITWLIVPLLALRFGVSGAAAGYALVGTSSVVAIYIARKFVNFSLVDSVLKTFMAAGIMGIGLIFLKSILPVELSSVWVLVGAGVALYSILIYLIVGPSIIQDVKKSFKTFFSR